MTMPEINTDLSTSMTVVPFGKYQGQPIESLLADANYLRWVTSQPGLMTMLQSRHPAVFNVITIGAPQSDDSPEHNQLQARFLRREFQWAFIEAATGERVYDTSSKLARMATAEATDTLTTLKRIASDDLAKSQGNLEEARHNLERKIDEFKQVDRENLPLRDYAHKHATKQLREWEERCRFEKAILDQLDAIEVSPVEPLPPEVKLDFECGYDVEFRARWYVAGPRVVYVGRGYLNDLYHTGKPRSWNSTLGLGAQSCGVEFSLELKPQVGDDFPSVLRQMKRNKANLLVIGSFEATTCTLDQVRQMFGDIKVVTMDQIEAILRRGVWPALEPK